MSAIGLGRTRGVVSSIEARRDASGTVVALPAPRMIDVRQSLRARLLVEDDAFDSHFPLDIRKRSSSYWTPLSVIGTAVDWLAAAGARSVLDVGSGPGKFIVAGALMSDLHFTGVEHRPSLHRAAYELADTMGVREQTTLIGDRIDALDMTRFDALYLFNPFGENRFSSSEQLDQSVELTEARFRRDVGAVEATLDRGPVGMLFMTYHGFGGRIPGSFFPLRSELAGSDVLRLWCKGTEDSRNECWIEVDGRAPLLVADQAAPPHGIRLVQDRSKRRA